MYSSPVVRVAVLSVPWTVWDSFDTSSAALPPIGTSLVAELATRAWPWALTSGAIRTGIEGSIMWSPSSSIGAFQLILRASVEPWPWC